MSKLHLSLPILLALAACGQPPSGASLAERHAVPALHVTAENAQIFIDHLDQILASPDQAGSLTVREFLNIMPMREDQREILLLAFTTPFSVTCSHGLCSAVTRGRPAQATMAIDIPGVGAPTLALDREVISGLARREGGVEFCNIQGMWAKKFFVTRKVQGLLLSLEDEGPTLVVNVDEDADNFTCE